ncbi:phage capsid protein [Ligilactobacillus salitolerans]|uniref:Phage capsid protein n=1 Tax=Ligilactobacillus salitolerans TaxID=1808352 RepID=A0A401IUK1_9LACO|nr:phage major capsid protein [Ligilactobacillus salitolerans]GBG95196.1 phage capsid protein [Ligilactobacillus salitolerans]
MNKLQVRASENDSHQIEGVAIVYNKPSQNMGFYEYIAPSALEGVDLSQLLLLYSHSYQNVLASVASKTLSVDNRDDGLHFSAQLPNTSLGNDVAELIATKRVSGMSFGFKIAESGDSWTKQDDKVIHTVNQIESMSEISITPIPAYQETQVSTQVKRSLEEFKKGVVRENMAENEVDLAGLLEKLIDKLGDSKPEPKAVKKDEPTEPEPVKEEPEADEGEDDRAAKKQTLPGVTTEAVVPAKKQQRDDEDVDTPDDSGGVAPDVSDIPVDDNDENAKKISEEKREVKPDEEKREVAKDMAQNITPQANVEDEQKRDFEEFLKKGKIERDANSHIALQDGSVIIPETILPAEHEQHQFPRLNSLVRKIAVKTTTGKLPVFMTSDDVLAPHTEFGASDRHAVPEIKPVPWDLKSYSSTYAYSQELLDDSQYNWESELQQRLIELRDNTDDTQIMTALTDGVDKVAAADGNALVQAIKHALDVDLKPNDARDASIVLSQSAFYALHQLQDKEGRDLIQPDMTNGASQRLLGKTLVVVADELFPEAKAGDINAVVAPMQKAVIEFKNNEITGKFMDNYDVFYRLLGIYERLDVVQARKDLIVYIGTAGE